MDFKSKPAKFQEGKKTAMRLDVDRIAIAKGITANDAVVLA